MTEEKELKSYAVTGTFHGSIVLAKTEGDARREFHRFYKGESIITVRLSGNGELMKFI